MMSNYHFRNAALFFVTHALMAKTNWGFTVLCFHFYLMERCFVLLEGKMSSYEI